MKLISQQEWAIVRLTTLQKKGQAGRLLFATITLLSPGRPLPPKMNSVDRHPVAGTKANIFFRRTTLSKQDAIEWYRSLGKGGEKSPIPTQPEERDEKDGVEIYVSQLIDNPIWPHLGLPIGDGLFSQPTEHDHPAPFLGNTPARIHRRFGNHEGFDALLLDDTALSFVARRMHIDLRKYPEYLGSAALISPDPIIKQIDNFIIPAKGEQGERIFYRFIPRPGQTLENLQITMFDEQAHLLTNFETRPIAANGILNVEKSDCNGTYGFVITHPKHGILAYMPPTGFIRQISFNLHAVSSGGTKINVPTGDSPNSARMEYLAANSSQTSTNTVGEASSAPNASVLVAAAVSRREKLASAKRYGCWIPPISDPRFPSNTDPPAL